MACAHTPSGENDPSDVAQGSAASRKTFLAQAHFTHILEKRLGGIQMQYVVLRDLSVLWGMFHVIFLFVMLFRSRYNRRKTAFLAGAGMGILMISNMIMGWVFGFSFLGKMFFFTCSVPSFVFFYIISADKKFRFILTFCLADTTSLWIMAVTNLLDFYLGNGKFVLMFFSRLIAFPLIEYLAYRYLRKPYLELQASVEKGWGIFSGMTMLYYILLVLVVQYPVNIVERPEDVLVCILILVLMLFTYSVIFSSLYGQLLLYRKQQNERILQEQLESQQRIRKLKHDMKGYTVTLTGLLAAGKMEEALEYLRNVQDEMDICMGQYCANPYINAVLGSFSQKFEQIGVTLELDVQIGDEQLPYMELCQIFSNGLENARDALWELPQEQRKVSVQMGYSKKRLTIRMKNTCSSALHVEKGTIPSTTKKGADHGFGLQTMLEAAQKIGGDMMCYTENGYFVVDVLLPMDIK